MAKNYLGIRVINQSTAARLPGNGNKEF